MAEWTVIVAVPADVAVSELQSLVAHLGYVDAQLDLTGERPTVTMRVRASIHDDAVRYGVDLIDRLLEGRHR